jgi:hypothetical protein
MADGNGPRPVPGRSNSNASRTVGILLMRRSHSTRCAPGRRAVRFRGSGLGKSRLLHARQPGVADQVLLQVRVEGGTDCATRQRHVLSPDSGEPAENQIQVSRPTWRL